MKITVTQPALPPLDELISSLEKIWENKQLTNQGPFHIQFENELAAYLGVKYVSLFANGTLALITALKALNIKGEVITTPFSFVATTHSLWWNNLQPIFADIEEETMTLNVSKVEAAITPNTSAILAVHVYGYPCQTESLKNIAAKYDLKIIYDAAHAFGVNKEGQSILNYGDLSVLSFHATKVFNTIEGGAIVCHDEKMKHHIDNLKNFGFRDETIVEEPGFNAKMNELQAAYGLIQLKYIDQYIAKRKKITEIYRNLLKEITGIKCFDEIRGVKSNYAYFPILVDHNLYGISRDELYVELQKYNIFCRRYFYPLISTFSPYNLVPSASPTNLPTATNIAEQIICLPIYPDLKLEDIIFISDKIKNFCK